MTVNEIKAKKKEAELQINKILQNLADKTNCDVDCTFSSYGMIITSNELHNKQIFDCRIEVKI